MVDVLGHLGMALLWLTVGRLAYRKRAALAFALLGVPFGLLPDIDLWLRRVLPTVHHHGVTHTVLFVTLASIVIGAVLGRWVVPALEGRYVPESEIHDEYRYAIGAVWLAGLSHLFADMLSAPDVSQPIEPLWPIVSQVVSFDVIQYSSPVWNWGLFAAGLAVTLLIWRFR